MTTSDQRWQELRDFGDCEPSALAFRAMVALLDTWPTDDRMEAIGRADQILKQWPDATRLAPWSWCKAASKGVVLPTWPLVRSLQLTSGHLSKEAVDLVRLAAHANLQHITELEIPRYSDFKELSLLYHRPELFPGLKRLLATDKYDDADVRALAGSPVWRSLEGFETESLEESFAHGEPSRIAPQLDRTSPIRHLTLRASDLMAVWDSSHLPQLGSVSVFVRSIDEAELLARRPELSQLTSLSLAFRCGFSGSSPFEPFLGTVIEADEAAADVFFGNARLDQLRQLAIVGYSMGYWGREGMGRLGLEALIASGVLQRLKRLRLELLPLGDKGIESLASALGTQLETLELVNLYCKGAGAAALIDSPCMPSLRQLDLSANRIDARHVSRMADADMPRLELLDLSGPEINPYYWNVGVQPVLDEGAAAWANSPNARRLKRWRLSNCHLTDTALAAIFRSSQLPVLTELDLSHSFFTAAGISQAMPGSPLWQTLKRLRLKDCRLGNDATEALTKTKDAPALRAIELGYNSIGPAGAAALAKWSVLSNVWQLDLHDNVIGDEGLVAIAESPNLGRLLELDFEQDCWNSRTFTFSDRAAMALVNSTSLPSLDCMFSGCVDEYHGTAYCPGFTKSAIGLLRKSRWMRPAARAACSDFSGIDEYHESGEFDETKELGDHDFRGHPFELNEQEADQKEHRMRQLASPRASDGPIDQLEPPKISPLPEIESGDDDRIEGIEFQDPIPVIDHQLTLSLSLESESRPLPSQVGKLLADTLGSVFRACSLGNFEVGGGSSRKGKDGRYIETDLRFHLGIKGDPDPALELIREALWWFGAPEETDLEDFPLTLSKQPAVTVTRFLQFATPEITRWSSGHRIDRVAFSDAQRRAIVNLVTEFGETGDGWSRVITSDGGQAAVYVKYLEARDEFNTLNCLVDSFTPELARLLHRLLCESGCMLFPMAIAASQEVAQSFDCDWPKVRVVTSDESLHQVLLRGPYHWWRDQGTRRR